MLAFATIVMVLIVVLAEIASRALSPAVNDPGTAIDVIGRGTRVISIWNDTVRKIREQDAERLTCEHVHMPLLVFRFRHLLPFAAWSRANVGTKRNTSNSKFLVQLLHLTFDREPCRTWESNVRCAALAASDMLDDLFGPIARDGAANIEVQTRLLVSLAAVAATGGSEFAQAARSHAELALKRSDAALAIEDDKHKLRALLAEWPVTTDGEACRIR